MATRVSAAAAAARKIRIMRAVRYERFVRRDSARARARAKGRNLRQRNPRASGEDYRGAVAGR
jgi:hypothetical protein